jgi:hypothetical protein
MKDIRVNGLGAYYANKLSKLSIQDSIQADELIEKFENFIFDFENHIKEFKYERYDCGCKDEEQRVESGEKFEPSQEMKIALTSLAQSTIEAGAAVVEELKIKDFKVLQGLLNSELGRLDYPTRNNVGTELLDTLKLDFQADTLNELDPLLYQAFYGLVKAKVDDILKEGAEDDGAFNS